MAVIAFMIPLRFSLISPEVNWLIDWSISIGLVFTGSRDDIMESSRACENI